MEETYSEPDTQECLWQVDSIWHMALATYINICKDIFREGGEGNGLSSWLGTLEWIV